ADVKDRIKKILDGLGLPTKFDGDLDEIINICRHDKKAAGDKISIVCVDEIGRYVIKNVPFCEFETIVRKGMQ
ncbi:MAG: 3-dehydroquinate synthase, partial [Clostridia bacterium]|nr:3-dehydroquinate synthase [Clostridia bacterium]